MISLGLDWMELDLELGLDWAGLGLGYSYFWEDFVLLSHTLSPEHLAFSFISLFFSLLLYFSPLQQSAALNILATWILYEIEIPCGVETHAWRRAVAVWVGLLLGC